MKLCLYVGCRSVNQCNYPCTEFTRPARDMRSSGVACGWFRVIIVKTKWGDWPSDLLCSRGVAQEGIQVCERDAALGNWTCAKLNHISALFLFKAINKLATPCSHGGTNVVSIKTNRCKRQARTQKPTARLPLRVWNVCKVFIITYIAAVFGFN